MIAMRYITVCSAFALAAHGTRNVGEISSHAQKATSGAEPPLDAIAEGGTAAHAHEQKMTSAAMQELMQFNMKSQQAVMTHTPLKATDLKPFNDAVFAKAEATTLKTMVSSHTVTVRTFLEAVQRYMEKDQERDQALGNQNALVEARTSDLEGNHSSILEELANDAKMLYCKQMKADLTNLENLMKLFEELKENTKKIQGKSQAMADGNTVHSEVAEGMGAVEEWANAETMGVCELYAPGGTALQFPEVASVVASVEGGAGHLLSDESACKASVAALLKYFSAAESEDEVKLLSLCGLEKPPKEPVLESLTSSETEPVMSYKDALMKNSLVEEKDSSGRPHFAAVHSAMRRRR